MKSASCRNGTADCSKSLNLTLKMGTGNQSRDQTFKFRGVTKRTQRYEANIRDCTRTEQGTKRTGKQVYLGGYDSAEKAARAHDVAALKFWGYAAKTNFQPTDYEKEVKDMENMTKEEVVQSLRRTSAAFSRGLSKYRGVTRFRGRWIAQIRRVVDNKHMYLGTFDTEEEAAAAYDTATIKYRGRNGITNFDIISYDADKIQSGESSSPTRNHSKFLKQTETSATADATSSKMGASGLVDQHQCESPSQHQSESPSQHQSESLAPKSSQLSDISIMPNQAMPSSSAGQIGENRLHDGVVYLVDPSTGAGYYMPRYVVIPIFAYQPGNAPPVFNMTIPNPFLQNLHVPNSQVDIAPTAQFQNVKR